VVKRHQYLRGLRFYAVVYSNHPSPTEVCGIGVSGQQYACQPVAGG
jgi:hypothetical protein